MPETAMYKAIIIEDEHHAARLLEQMLMGAEIPVEVVDKCEDLPAGIKSIKRHQPDVVFLDIELPVYSGIQILDFFNPEEINFQIIFTTAFNDYAIKAFEMCAVDYLMKPLQEDKLLAALQKLLRPAGLSHKNILPVLQHNLRNTGNKKIVLPLLNGFEVLNLQDICYFKAEGSYTTINTSNGESHLISKNLKHFENLLEDNEIFLRVHRSIIVNILFIKRLARSNGNTLVLTDETELPISEDRTEELLTKLKKM